jgi:hypothetical protein
VVLEKFWVLAQEFGDLLDRQFGCGHVIFWLKGWSQQGWSEQGWSEQGWSEH